MTELTVALTALLISGLFAFSATRAIGRGELYKGATDYVSRAENSIVFWRLVIWRSAVSLACLLIFAYAFLALLGTLGLVKLEL